MLGRHIQIVLSVYDTTIEFVILMNLYRIIFYVAYVNQAIKKNLLIKNPNYTKKCPNITYITR